MIRDPVGDVLDALQRDRRQIEAALKRAFPDDCGDFTENHRGDAQVGDWTLPPVKHWRRHMSMAMRRHEDLARAHDQTADEIRKAATRSASWSEVARHAASAMMRRSHAEAAATVWAKIAHQEVGGRCVRDSATDATAHCLGDELWSLRAWLLALVEHAAVDPGSSFEDRHDAASRALALGRLLRPDAMWRQQVIRRCRTVAVLTVTRPQARPDVRQLQHPGSPPAPGAWRSEDPVGLAIRSDQQTMAIRWSAHGAECSFGLSDGRHVTVLASDEAAEALRQLVGEHNNRPKRGATFRWNGITGRIWISIGEDAPPAAHIRIDGVDADRLRHSARREPAATA